VSRHARILFLIAVCLSCKPAPKQPAKPAAGPQVRATVVTIRTTIDNTSVDHALVIARDKVRFTGENDLWRLYDPKAGTVVFVDDVARTIRSEPLAAIAARRRSTNAADLGAHFPSARIQRTTNTKLLHSAVAREAVIESGAYRRQLWLAEHPAIPRGLFAMMHISDSTTSPLAPMMRAVDETLGSERGFPLADRATIGDQVIAERTVTSIVQKDVPEALVTLPKGYRDVTPVARNPQR
jgi:hypothetical protein